MTSVPPPSTLSVALANVLAARMESAARPTLLAAAVRPDGPPELTVGAAVGMVLPMQRRPLARAPRFEPAPEPDPAPSAA